MRHYLMFVFVLALAVNSNAAKLQFKFYGTELSVKAKKYGFPGIENLDTVSIDKALATIEKKGIFDSTLRNCLALKEMLRLNDWGYFVMLDELSSTYAEKYANSPAISKLIMAYLCSKSEYDVVLGCTDDDQLVLFYHTNGLTVFDAPRYIYNKKVYFQYVKKKSGNNKGSDKIMTKAIGGSGYKSLDFRVFVPPLLKQDTISGQHLETKNSPGGSFTVTLNKNLIDFYNDYPVTGDRDTYYVKYAETPLSEGVKKQLYPVMRQLMSGKDQLSNVNCLLGWLQGFSYATDKKVWGYDRPFFPEETLYYKFSDSEDRAALFARLVTDLLGLKTVLCMDSTSRHVVIGVNFTEGDVMGDYVLYGGEKYLICDPILFNAPTGHTTNEFKTSIIIPITN